MKEKIILNIIKLDNKNEMERIEKNINNEYLKENDYYYNLMYVNDSIENIEKLEIKELMIKKERINDKKRKN